MTWGQKSSGCTWLHRALCHSTSASMLSFLSLAQDPSPFTRHDSTMKFVKVVVAVLVGLVLAVEPTAADSEAAVHLRVTAKDLKICYKACPSGQYCARGTTICRAPGKTECFDPARGLFRKGCDYPSCARTENVNMPKSSSGSGLSLSSTLDYG